MSAHAYIQWADVPQALIDSSRQRMDDNGAVKLVAFVGCPLVGQIEELSGGRIQIEYPWPQVPDLRHGLGDWLSHHGINYVVVH
ncbi:phage portal protein [Paraburkholderia diazotrophica]|uniref:Uncharacterized protein n=1 Tax=Paraburkholderia diazotrophica TaxID=667676 RepID=A0A1H6QME0_9BURK|nr:phage portal protein [Paraburkholderia diazotrophica]SEI42194.1 hypothetical protein SAMN05192539_1001300 [Paraburkholderia diazotrophica]